jgi:signal transduction histidine kinase
VIYIDATRSEILTDELTTWLRAETEALCRTTLERAPNMLPDRDDIAGFLDVVVNQVTAPRDVQFSSIQNWAYINIGQDPLVASNWVTLLRVIKAEVGERLEEDFPAETALHHWRQLDDIFTFALVETSQLARDEDRATMLEHMVKLRQQMKRLERAKTDFVSVAAHELRTPLTILEGYVNMLRVEIDHNSSLGVYVDGLSSGTQRMQEIISDMIDVTLIDTQSFGLNYQQFYLEKIILIAADNLDKYFRERNVTLDIAPPPVDQLRIFGDPVRLIKALSKVLLNALKYTPDGGVVRVVSELTRQREVDENIAGYIDIQVIDSGIGIAADDLEKIFDKFTSGSDVSLHSSGKIKFKGGGAGLGLPIAKGIVEAHGGRVWAESPGYNEQTLPGSIFHIELPLWRHEPPVIREE